MTPGRNLNVGMAKSGACELLIATDNFISKLTCSITSSPGSGASVGATDVRQLSRIIEGPCIKSPWAVLWSEDRRFVYFEDGAPVERERRLCRYDLIDKTLNILWKGRRKVLEIYEMAFDPTTAVPDSVLLLATGSQLARFQLPVTSADIRRCCFSTLHVSVRNCLPKELWSLTAEYCAIQQSPEPMYISVGIKRPTSLVATPSGTLIVGCSQTSSLYSLVLREHSLSSLILGPMCGERNPDTPDDNKINHSDHCPSATLDAQNGFLYAAEQHKPILFRLRLDPSFFYPGPHLLP